MAIYSTMQNRRFFRFALVIFLPALAAQIVLGFLPSRWLLVSKDVTFILYFALIIMFIARDIFQHRRVTGDTIAGAMCVYLLLGLTWAFLYSALEGMQPSSFRFPQDQQSIIAATATKELHLPFIYFSFVTLTTLGFGDITPITVAAKTLTWMEALIGQLFLATTIASLVGLRVSHRQGNQRHKDG